jgi:hypothetical protein
LTSGLEDIKVEIKKFLESNENKVQPMRYILVSVKRELDKC